MGKSSEYFLEIREVQQIEIDKSLRLKTAALKNLNNEQRSK
jgi:hypothetical protein